MGQVTERCHIIRRGYIKGFTNDKRILCSSEKKDGKRNNIIKRKVKKTSGKTKPLKIGYELNLFNYYSYNKGSTEDGTRVDDLEKNMGNHEEKTYSQFIKDLQKEIDDTSNISTKTIKSSKKTIINMLSFMLYKIYFSHIKNYLYGSSDYKVTKKERDEIDKKSKHMAKVGGFFKELLESNFSRAYIYTEIPIISSGDYPFHIRPNTENNSNDGNNLDTFLKRKGSNLYFPLNKKLAIIIEYNTPAKDSFYYIRCDTLINSHKNTANDREEGKITSESLFEVIQYRVIQNCQEYIIGASQQVLKDVLDNYTNITRYYRKDPLKYSVDKYMPKK